MLQSMMVRGRRLSGSGVLNLGVLWPVDVYRKRFNQEPPRASLTIRRHAGRMVRGIILDKVHGEPPGTLTLTETDESYAMTTSAVDESEVQLAFDAVAGHRARECEFEGSCFLLF